MKPLSYFMENLNSLSPMDYRSLHRYYLLEQDKRLCSVCKKIYDNIKSNFNVKKYNTTKPYYDSRCKFCQSKQNLVRQIEYRNDPKVYIKSKVTAYKARAKEIGVPFDLTADYLYNQFLNQNEICYYTKQALSFTHIIEDRKTPHPLLASLDRKDPWLGYVKGNVVWCTYFVNRMKNECSYNEFIKLCGLIYSNHTS